MDVGEVERHGTTLGDLLGFVEMTASGVGIAEKSMPVRGGEQGFGELINITSFAEAVESGGEVRIGIGG